MQHSAALALNLKHDARFVPLNRNRKVARIENRKREARNKTAIVISVYPRNKKIPPRNEQRIPVTPPARSPPASWLFINRDFFCYSIADPIGDLSHAASLCNYAGECTTRNKIAEKSIRNATTRTASKIASSSDTGENNQRRVISRPCPQGGGKRRERPTTRVIDCGTHAPRGRHLSFLRAIKPFDART